MMTNERLAQVVQAFRIIEANPMLVRINSRRAELIRDVVNGHVAEGVDADWDQSDIDEMELMLAELGIV